MNNIPAAKANQIFDLLEKFAGYGFNKSHAAAYAMVAYQTAYLKANYPVEFFCAMMTNDMADTDKLSQYIAEARGMGIEVLPPDVNESQVYFAPAQSRAGVPPAQPAVQPQRRTGRDACPTLAIRFGLAAIKGVGEIAVEAILKARREGGRFQSLADLCERVDGRSVNRKVLEALIKSGACDCLGQTRATLFAQIDRTLARAASIIADRQRGQASLFGALEDRSSQMPESESSLPEWPEHELLAHEKELLGFYVTGHPLTPYAPILEKYALANTATLAQLPTRSLTRIGGLIAAVQNGVSKKSGKPYSLVTLEDLEGSVQVLCLNENYDKYRELLAPGKAILVIGEVNIGDDKPKIFPQEIMPLEDAPARFTKQVHLRLHTAHLKPEHLDVGARTGRRASGQVPLVPVFRAAGGRGHFHGDARDSSPSRRRGRCSRPPTTGSARKPTTRRWTRACRNARRAAGNGGRRGMARKAKVSKSEVRSPKEAGKQEPALATEGQGGLEETRIGGYFVASASAPGTGTTGEQHPHLGAEEIHHGADNEGEHGRGRDVHAEVRQDAHHEARRPGHPAGRVEARARAGPFAAGEQVVHHHRAADRTEGGADDLRRPRWRLPATPVTARTMLTTVPMPTEMNGFTLGSVVLKLLAAINAEKQAGGKAARASRNITHFALSGPSTVGMRFKARLRLSLPSPGASAWNPASRKCRQRSAAKYRPSQ